jgi:hypothetical protein
MQRGHELSLTAYSATSSITLDFRNPKTLRKVPHHVIQ